MQKYSCDKGHKFQHTAKAFKHNQDEPLIQEFEVPCCPVCAKDGQINVAYEEVIEEVPKVVSEPISDLICVPNAQVSEKIAAGYQVMEDKIYAKETILIKRGQPKQPEENYHFQTTEALPEWSDVKEKTYLWQFRTFEEAAEARELLKKHQDIVAEAKAHPDVPLVPWGAAFITWQNFMEIGNPKEVTKQ